ncbi:MAG: sensor histidine kinase [Solirubrobacteraceae bacterium]
MAAGVGYLVWEKPANGLQDSALVAHVAIAMALIGAGVYVRADGIQPQMGALLAASGAYSGLWILTGSSDALVSSMGVLCLGLAPAVFAYLVLAHPTGRLSSRTDRRFLAIACGATAAPWTLVMLTSAQPPVRTPLVACSARCPGNSLFLHVDAAAWVPVLNTVVLSCWIVLAIGTAVLITRRSRSALAPLRRALAPVRAIAIAIALCLVASLIVRLAGSGLGRRFEATYIELYLSIPLAILVGLTLERLFMGRALAEIVEQLARFPRADPQSLISGVLHDPSLRIVYRRPALGTYVDAAGACAKAPTADAERAVTWIERDQLAIAAVSYDRELTGQECLVHAAGAAAMMRLEKTQLEADLRASATDLAASRARLIETAHAERRRIERDLHDGIQQDVLVLRIGLDTIAETITHEPERAGELLGAAARQMDDLLDELRSLARGIYPAVLERHGIVEALGSATRRSEAPASVQGGQIGRYPEEVEVAVYFCCLEALQNVAKHAGTGPPAAVRVWQQGQRLCFSVRDSGRGFDAAQARSGRGLLNMRDRIEAVGGTFTVMSRPGSGTVVSGSIPLDCFSNLPGAAPRDGGADVETAGAAERLCG